MEQEKATTSLSDEEIRIESTEDSTDKKCPNCGATIVYDPQTRGLLCEYCGYQQSLPDPESCQAVTEQDFYTAQNKQSFDWGAEKKVIICSNCAGESIYDALETAAVCPFCGSTSVMPAAVEDSIAPGGVCPFEIPVKQAGGLFEKWLKRKIFVPSDAKKQAKPESFKGVYLPYWTFDTMTTSAFNGKAGFDHQVKRGDRYVTETDWRSVSGVYQEFVDDQMVVASKRSQSSGVKQAQPFDFSKLRPYQPELVAGFVAERYSIGLDDGWKDAQGLITRQLDRSIAEYIRKTWHADHGNAGSFSTQFDKITYKYLLVPVWISSFIYKGKNYQFVVNGQTGKVGGKTPLSIWRILAAGAIGLLILFLYMYFVNR